MLHDRAPALLQYLSRRVAFTIANSYTERARKTAGGSRVDIVLAKFLMYVLYVFAFLK